MLKEILMIFGALYLIQILYGVSKEWLTNEKKDPWINRIGQDNIDQIKLEKEEHQVGWSGGKPFVVPKKNKNK